MHHAARVLVLLAAALPASADTLTLAPAADTTLYAESPTHTNGAGGSLQAGPNSQGHARRALLRFDVAAALPPGAQVVSARLELRCSQSSGGPAAIALHRLLESWGEGLVVAPGSGGQGAPAQPGDATWDERFFGSASWTTSGGHFVAGASASVVIPGVGEVALESAALAADVQLWLEQPALAQGWIVLGAEASVGTAKRLESRESTELAARPRLVLTYDPGLASCTPEDGAGALCPCANPGLAGRGCENAAGTGGVRLAAQDWLPDGSGGGSVTFSGSGFPPAQAPGVVLLRSSGAQPLAFDDGVLCLAQPLARVAGARAQSGALTLALQHAGGAGAFVYQLWYRSAPAAFCTPGASNLSNAYRLVW